MKGLVIRTIAVIAIAGAPLFALAQETDAETQRAADVADRQDHGEWGWLGLLGLGGLLGLKRRDREDAGIEGRRAATR